MTKDQTNGVAVSGERLAEMLAGLEGVTPGPWEASGANIRHKHGPLLYTSENNAPHLARCDPDTIRAILTELQALRLQSSPASIEAVSGEVAWRDVIAERKRQVEAEGWTPEHDDEHDDCEMARAAACYAYGRIIQGQTIKGPPFSATINHWSLWPWDLKWWKPRDQRQNLVRAAALLLAEIERLDRKEARK
jgi:hypothetical protein